MKILLKRLAPALITASCLAAALGCSAAPDDPSSERVHRSSAALAIAIPADADLSVPTDGHLVFSVTTSPENVEQVVWEERVDAPVFGGAQVTVTATRERFPSCGIGGEVTAFVRTDDGTILEVPLDQGDPAGYRAGAFQMPAGVSSAEVWLRAQTPDGCEEWDSDFERNYPIAVYDWTPVVLTFDAQWNETETVLPAGGVAVLDYDFARLPECRTSYRGYPSWDIVTHARFDDGAQLRQSMIRLGYNGQGVPDGTVAANRVLVPLPRGAKLVEFWFENTQYPPTCQAWDSDFGRNFSYAIVHGGVMPGTEGEVTCAAGALVVRQNEPSEAASDPVFTAIVADQPAIDYFLARSQESHDEQVSMYGGGTVTLTVQSYLPYNVAVEGEGDARKMLVTDLRPSLAGGFAAGQFLANLDAVDAGLALSITNMTMPNSHTAVQWQMGSWTFADCAGR